MLAGEMLAALKEDDDDILEDEVLSGLLSWP
jgi:hypothetical protein